MDIQAPIRKFDEFQQRRTPLAVLFGTIKKFGDDNAGSYAVAVAFYAFFSVFPLLLVFMTILGYVLAGDQSLMASVTNSVLGRFPVIGDTLRHHRLEGSALALIAGVVLSLWSSLGVTGAMTTALDQVWGVPKRERSSFVKTKLRGLLLILGLGLLFVIATGASGIVSNGLGGPVLHVFGIIVALSLNVLLFLATFRFLCSAPPDLDDLFPGAIAAGVAWTVLQFAGGVYIDHIKTSNSAYGTFALVLGILAWLHLGSMLTLYCAEFSTVLAGRHWPVSVLGGDEPESAGEPARASAASGS